MTLADAIKKAEETKNVSQWREVLEFLRFRLGLSHRRAMNCVKKVFPDLTHDRWEELLRQVDDDSRLPAVTLKHLAGRR
jgi:(p)ppGpp synthase/HD superfamily hydrolase